MQQFVCAEVGVSEELTFVVAQVTHSGRSLQVIPNLALQDSTGQSVLGTALWAGSRLQIAELLLGGGANVNDVDAEGRTLLLQAIRRCDVDSALFLLRHQADPNARQVIDHYSSLHQHAVVVFATHYRLLSLIATLLLCLSLG